MDENKDQRINILRATIFDQDLNMAVGLRLYREANISNTQYRRDNARLQKENDILRIALENRGVYIDNALEEIDDPTLTPLGLERAKHENTKKQLELERSKVGTLEADYNRRIVLFTRNEDTLRARNLKLEQELNKLRRTNPGDR